MASLTMMTSILGSPSVTDRPSISHRRSLIVAKASSKPQDVSKNYNVKVNVDNDNSNGRRSVMFAAAAAAVCAIGQGIAQADEPKPGTPEAKKFYAPVCVTMPTAKVCHK